MLLKAIARFDSKKMWTRVDRPISRPFWGAFTRQRKNGTNGSDKKWNGSNHVCKETVNLYPFRYHCFFTKLNGIVPLFIGPVPFFLCRVNAPSIVMICLSTSLCWPLLCTLSTAKKVILLEITRFKFSFRFSSLSETFLASWPISSKRLRSFQS